MDYYVTHSTVGGFKIIVDKIKDTGENAYKYYNCVPLEIIELKEEYDEFEKGKQFVFFKNYNDHEIDYYRFLGFGFEGLYEDTEKINVIEQFGKYRCIVYTSEEVEFPENIICRTPFVFNGDN